VSRIADALEARRDELVGAAWEAIDAARDARAPAEDALAAAGTLLF
jgi:hypothetical protein